MNLNKISSQLITYRTHKILRKFCCAYDACHSLLELKLKQQQKQQQKIANSKNRKQTNEQKQTN